MLPLISYCVKCYNQEHYIQQALKAAFAQTYEPLEILICDDCSTDRSDEVIRKAIADYQAQGGHHQIRYYRNEKNLGNLGNWQRICELAAGELLVKADGDDYSEPERTAKLVEAWLRSGKSSNEVVSDGMAVSASGKELWRMEWHPGAGLGGFAAFTKKCSSEFPPVDDELGHEGADDVVYITRAELLGGAVEHVPCVLTYYRQGSGETSCGIKFTRMMTRGFRFMVASYKQSLIDLECVRGRLNFQEYELFRARFARMVKHHEALLDLWLGRSFSVRVRGYETARELHVISRWLGLFLLLPGWINKPILNSIFRINYWRKTVL